MSSRPIRSTTEHTVSLDGREIVCQLTRSTAAKKLRLKVSFGRLEIVVPYARQQEEGISFLKKNGKWALLELERSKQRLSIRRPSSRRGADLLYRGDYVSVHVTRVDNWLGTNRVSVHDGALKVLTGPKGHLSVTRSIENWLRKQAREEVLALVESLKKKLNRSPNRVYVMGQRTKWGNCSALGNLSFNWRLIMAPAYVLQYLVVHEFVHLAVPDHSQKFWLTVQSLCRDSEKARRWLVAHEGQLSRALRDPL